jgi:hypothetical protein
MNPLRLQSHQPCREMYGRTVNTATLSRPSPPSANLAEGLPALKGAGCDVIRAEKRSGTTTVGREERTVLSARAMCPDRPACLIDGRRSVIGTLY